MISKYSSYILCFLISILVVALYVNDFSPLVRLEWKIQDILYSFRGADNYSNDIILLNIDDQTLNEYGNWPWNRDKMADLLAAVGSGEPKTVMLNTVFDHNTTQDTLGYTEILAGQMSWMKNVIVPYEISQAEFRTKKISMPDYLKNQSVQVDSDLGILSERATLLARKVFLPPDLISQYASGLGFKFDVRDSDRKLRWIPLVMHYDGFYYPSATLITAAQQLGVAPSQIKIYEGQKVMLGGLEIPTNDKAQLFINYNKPGKSFQQLSAVDILNEKIEPVTFKDKLVIISVTSDIYSEYFNTPVSPELPENEKVANVIENIVHTNFVKRLDSSAGIDLMILFGLGILFAFVLPRVSLLYRVVILTISFFVLANANFVLFNSYGILTRSLYIGLELFLLFLAAPIIDKEFLARFGLLKEEYLSRPGNQETKPKPPRRKSIIIDPEPAVEAEPARDSVKSTLREKDKEFEQDATVATSTSDSNKDGMVMADSQIPDDARSDIPTEMNNIDDVEDVVSHIDEEPEVTAEPATHEPIQKTEAVSLEQDIMNDSDSTGLIAKNLGRYKVLEILGKGAMGTVYKGVDPAINRNVALKTIRLDFVSDPAELAELKERLFREARAAGMLSHPNIVTIYDVGTEKKLQYIAMEYIEGSTLEDMIRRNTKFNLRIVAQMITQICGALEYAHSQKIIHRDIKPANIMVQKDYTVKVMDFGIARVDSTSMTRTGIAMGTPNYIAPEQLQGKTVDNRCDIFSLGVVIYEMLTGRRPFSGENLTSLIYNIVNKEPEPPSTVDKSIPNLFDRVTLRALKKEPGERYQKASEIKHDIKDFISSFSQVR
jgi:serine/threonine-protein kinase